jgi:hypothetical protein
MTTAACGPPFVLPLLFSVTRAYALAVEPRRGNRTKGTPLACPFALPVFRLPGRKLVLRVRHSLFAPRARTPVTSRFKESAP